MTSKGALLLTSLSFLLGACESPTGPEFLQPELLLSATEISPGERFSVTLTVTNPMDQDVEFSTSSTAFAYILVMRDGERQRWPGTGGRGGDAVTTHRIPAGASVQREFTPTVPDDAEPAIYQLRVSSFYELTTFPSARAEVRVVDPGS